MTSFKAQGIRLFNGMILMTSSKAQGIRLFNGIILMSTKLENRLKDVTVALF
jgi:hypothetical protein